MSIFVSVLIDENVKVECGEGVLSHLICVGKGLALNLPYDAQKRKETLLWLATQLEFEAKKL